MGVTAVSPFLKSNQSPSAPQQCFELAGNGDRAISIASSSGSLFTSIDASARAVELYNGRDQRLLIGNSKILKPLQDDFTISVWVRLARRSSRYAISSTSFMWIAGHGNEYAGTRGWSIYATTTRLVMRVNEGNDSLGRHIPGSIMDERWHHIAMVIDRSNSGRVLSYLDGELTGVPGYRSGNTDRLRVNGIVRPENSKSVTLGARDGASLSLPLEGTVDGFAIWRSALSAETIRGIYNSWSSSRDLPSLIQRVCPYANGSSSPAPVQQPPVQQPPVQQPPVQQPPVQQPPVQQPPVQQPPEVVVPPTTSPPLADPCRCTETGYSGPIIVYSAGCSITVQGRTYCYVEDPINCQTASPSQRYPGAKYRTCT